jgi:hypothetical protein
MHTHTHFRASTGIDMKFNMDVVGALGGIAATTFAITGAFSFQKAMENRVGRVGFMARYTSPFHHTTPHHSTSPKPGPGAYNISSSAPFHTTPHHITPHHITPP